MLLLAARQQQFPLRLLHQQPQGRQLAAASRVRPPRCSRGSRQEGQQVEHCRHKRRLQLGPRPQFGGLRANLLLLLLLLALLALLLLLAHIRASRR